MEDFAEGFGKFVSPPEIGPFGDAPEKAQQYGKEAATSCPRPIQHGSNLLVTISAPAPDTVIVATPGSPRHASWASPFVLHASTSAHTPETSVLAGCSEERPNTRRTHQLAFFSRSSHCSSGNVSSLADNAIYGKSRHQAIYCDSAVGTSQRSHSGAELDASEVWSVQGQSGLRVVCCHPPVNLGRNLFPPRRFSYHTRFSRFNGTAS
jgi:hypothetical protein